MRKGRGCGRMEEHAGGSAAADPLSAGDCRSPLIVTGDSGCRSAGARQAGRDQAE
jgi:hypothetical protein